MEIRRDIYLNKLIRKKGNGLIKIVTGIRRCGKSYLLFRLFHNHLSESGVDNAHIIEIALDDRMISNTIFCLTKCSCSMNLRMC